MSALFIDEQHRLHVLGERLPQRPADDVVADVVDALVAELRIAQPRDRVVLVEALLGLGRGLDMPLQERPAHAAGDLLGELGLAGAGLALDQDGTPEGDGGVDRGGEILGRDVAVGAGEAVLGGAAAWGRGFTGHVYTRGYSWTRGQFTGTQPPARRAGSLAGVMKG